MSVAKAALVMNKTSKLFITPFQSKPSEGYILLQQVTETITETMYYAKQTRTVRLRGDILLLAEKFTEGQEFDGNIIKESSFTPFFAGQSACMNPTTGEMMRKDGKQYYVNFIFDTTSLKKDYWITPINEDEESEVASALDNQFS